jgi:glycosyltransferase involved in cell wall biosynthesis
MRHAASVVIPCYNDEEFLGMALDSVHGQTVPVREILLVDDGSTVPIRMPSGWDGPPLHIIRTRNQGLAAARNVGLLPPAEKKTPSPVNVRIIKHETQRNIC